jgi:hypothetical protein
MALVEAALASLDRSGERTISMTVRASLATSPPDPRAITQGPAFYEPLTSPPRGHVRFVLVGGAMEYVDIRGEQACEDSGGPAGDPSLEFAENVSRVHAMTASAEWARAAVATGQAIMTSLARAGADPRPSGLILSHFATFQDAVQAATGSMPQRTIDDWRTGGANKSRWSCGSNAKEYVFGAKAGYSYMTVDEQASVCVFGWPDRSDLCLQAFADTIAAGAAEPVTIILPDVPSFRDFARRYVRGEHMGKVGRALMEEAMYRPAGYGLAERGYLFAALHGGHESG